MRPTVRTRGVSAATWCLVVLAIAAGAFAALWIHGRRKFAPAGPNREIAPASLGAWIEMRDGISRWNEVMSAPSWTDLQGSKMWETIGGSTEVKEFRETVHELFSKAKYELSAANVMKFVGRDLGIGFEPRASAAPAWLVVTKLDVEGLTTDFLAGDGDFSKIHDALDAKVGAFDVKVTRVQHRGQTVTTAAKGSSTFHFAQLGDTLAISDDASLLAKAIDCHLGGGAGSIGREATFQAETAKLSAVEGTSDAIATIYVNLGLLREGRASCCEAARKLGGEGGAGAVGRILDGTTSMRGLAAAFSLPKGDLYSLQMRFSSPPPGARMGAAGRAMDALPASGMTCEIRNMDAALAAWGESSLRRRLGKAWADKSVDKLIAAISERSAKKSGHTVGRFELNMTAAVMSEALRATAEGGVAIQLDLGKSDPRMTTIVQPGMAGYLAVLAAAGAASADSDAVVSEYRGCTTFTAAGDREMYAAFSGSTIVLANDEDLLHGTVDRLLDPVAAAGDAAASRRSSLVAGVAKGAQILCYLNLEDFADEMEALAAHPAVNMRGTEIAFAVEAGPAFRHVEMRYSMTRPAGTAYFAPPAATPRTLAMMPGTPIMYGASFIDLPLLHERQMRPAAEALGITLDENIAELDARLGVRLIEDVLPALGSELAFALSPSAPVPPPAAGALRDEPAVPIPGFTFMVQTKNQAVVRKFIDGLLDMVRETIADQNTARGRRAGPDPIVREMEGPIEVFRMTSQALDGAPVRPAIAYHDDFVILTTDADLLRGFADTSAGRASGAGASPVVKRQRELLPAWGQFAYMDWSALVEQLSLYEPQIAPLMAGDDVPAPDFPEDPDKEAIEKWQEAVTLTAQQRAANGAIHFRALLDALRAIDSIGTTNRETDTTAEGVMVIRFRD